MVKERLDKLLVERGLVENRTRAQALILAGQVLVDEQRADKPGHAIDTSADPCIDFYQYACGNWLKANPVPADQARWVRSFSLVQQRNLYFLWKDLDSAAAHPKDGAHSDSGADTTNRPAACRRSRSGAR